MLLGNPLFYISICTNEKNFKKESTSKSEKVCLNAFKIKSEQLIGVYQVPPDVDLPYSLNLFPWTHSFPAFLVMASPLFSEYAKLCFAGASGVVPSVCSSFSSLQDIAVIKLLCLRTNPFFYIYIYIYTLPHGIGSRDLKPQISFGNGFPLRVVTRHTESQGRENRMSFLLIAYYLSAMLLSFF